MRGHYLDQNLLTLMIRLSFRIDRGFLAYIPSDLEDATKEMLVDINTIAPKKFAAPGIIALTEY